MWCSGIPILLCAFVDGASKLLAWGESFQHDVLCCVQIWQAASYHVAVNVLLHSDLVKHHECLQKIVEDVSSGVLQTTACIVAQYKELQEATNKTGRLWRRWLFLAILFDGAVCACYAWATLFEISHGQCLWAFNAACGLLLSTLFVVAQVWPVAAWNDALSHAAATFQFDDTNRDGLLLLGSLLTSRSCKVEVAGILALTRRGVIKIALAILVSPALGKVLQWTMDEAVH